MTAPRSSPPTNPSAWYALREYLADAYSNREMRLLVELTLLAEAGSRLPDERVSAQEYAAMLCALIQRHSGCPVPEFWRQLVADRPLRQPEVHKLMAIFGGSTIPAKPAAGAAKSVHSQPSPNLAMRLVGAALLSTFGVGTAYCATLPRVELEEQPRRADTGDLPAPLECSNGAPSSMPGAAPSECDAVAPVKPKLECRDGTESPTCDEPGPGCCSRHGGIRPADSQERVNP